MRDEMALAAWDLAAERLTPPARALRLLGLIRPEIPLAERAKWSVGRRNSALLTARLELFGAEVTAVARCPVCAATVEAAFDGYALQSAAGAAQFDAAAFDAAQFDADDAPPIVVAAAGWRMTLRPLNTADLIAVAEEESFPEESGPEEMAYRLLRRCITAIAAPPGIDPQTTAWPYDCAFAAASALTDADPLAETQLSLTCPDCGQGWEADFDIPEFFLTELAAHGERVLDDVHRLASQYGWSERDILAIPPARRAAYRERAG